MIDTFFNALKIDEFFLALAGQVATDAWAKVTLSAVKAAGLSLIGAVVDRSDVPQPTKASAARRRKKRRRARPNTRKRRSSKSR